MLLRVSIAKAGEDVTRCPEFTKPEVTIGRRPTNDVILPDDGVSGSHARLLVTGRTLTLVDQGSTNGTFVAGERLEGPRTVAPHDEVLISDYRLTFSLVDISSAEEGVVRTPVAPGGTAEVPLSEALGWSEDDPLPPPPPLLDGPVADPIPVSSAAVPPTTSYPAVPPTMAPPSGAPRVVARQDPSLPIRQEAPSAVPVPTPIASPSPAAQPRPMALVKPGASDDSGFAFDPAGAQSLHEQVFAAVWDRVAQDVVSTVPGIDARVHSLLDAAISAASQQGQLAAGTREQIAQEILSGQVLETLLKGEPDDVMVLGTSGVRVDRRGHVSVGPSPLSCATAVVALGSRLCGTVVDREHPMARSTHGSYAVQAIHGSTAGGVPMVSLRRTPSSKPSTIEELESSGALAAPHAHILRAAVRAGLRIVICVGPGAVGRPMLGALMAAAASNELQVVVAPQGADPRGLRTGTVLLNRDPNTDAVDAALRLGPSRLGLEDLPWSDRTGLDALTSSSVRTIATIGARSAWVGLRRLVAMLDGSQGVGVSAPSFVAASIDLFVTIVASRDEVPRVTGLSEPLAQPNGEVELSELTTYDPQAQTWTARLGASPCLDDLVHRGLLDPRVFGPMTPPEPSG